MGIYEVWPPPPGAVYENGNHLQIQHSGGQDFFVKYVYVFSNFASTKSQEASI